MKFLLAYVNMPDTEHYLDKEFKTMVELMAYVNQQYKGWTSYSINVMAK